MKNGLGKFVMKLILGGAVIMLMGYLFEGRSEERRVGKECKVLLTILRHRPS